MKYKQVYATYHDVVTHKPPVGPTIAGLATSGPKDSVGRVVWVTVPFFGLAGEERDRLAATRLREIADKLDPQ